jgi:hypothetical protein
MNRQTPTTAICVTLDRSDAGSLDWSPEDVLWMISAGFADAERFDFVAASLRILW